MGVNTYVMITWDFDGMKPWLVKEFGPGAVTMPCFHEDGVLWIELEERDDIKNDKM